MRWARLYPDAFWMTLWFILFMIFEFIVLYQSFYPVMSISETALYQTIGISAQIVAGLYGITLTGYIFFLEHLQQLKRENESLQNIVDALKQRYHTMVKVISMYVVAIVILSIILMLYGTNNSFFPEKLIRFLTYENCILALTATGFIVYFVMNVVDPDKIQKISYQYKERLSSSDETCGDVKEFLKDYLEIECIFMKYLNQISETDFIFLQKSEIQLKTIFLWKTDWKEKLIDEVLKLRKYYNYLVFSQEMIVSQEMCILAKDVKKQITNV